MPLIHKAIQGDDDSFNSLMKPYMRQAQQTAYLLLFDYALAEDVVQEALIQAHASIKWFNNKRASFKTWFNRIVIKFTKI